MKKFLTPTGLKVIVFFIELIWSFVFIFGLSYFSEVESFFSLVREGVQFVSWDGYVLMKLSYLTLWFIVSMFIFALAFVLEFISIYFHNKRVEKGYVGAVHSKTSTFAFHGRRSMLFWTLAIFILTTSLFYLPVVYAWLLNPVAIFLESEFAKIINAPKYQYSSFLVAAFFILSPIWYFAAATFGEVLEQGSKLKVEEKLNEEHNATESTF